MEDKKRVAIYVRVSSNEQKREGLSIDAQKRKLTNYAESKGWEIYNIYIDDGVSAKIPIKKRPQGKQMFDDIKNKKFSIILIIKLDRAFRNTVDAILTSDEFRLANIDFISLSENIDTTSAMGKFFFTLMSALAQLERELTADRNKDISLDKFTRGIYPHKIPFGYKAVYKNKKDKKGVIGIVVDNKKSLIVKDIFQMTLDGISYREICKKYKLKPQVYYNIIKNKVYLGIISFDGIEKKGKHHPLISEELFEKINKK